MQRQLLISGVVLSLLAGCASVSQSKVNPLNWFGASEDSTNVEQQVTPARANRPSLEPSKGFAHFVDTRSLIAEVTDVAISRTSTGAIITATGRAPSLGFFDAQLVPVASADPSALQLEFRIQAPRSTKAGTGNLKQREIVVARSISTGELAALSSVTVRGATGSRTTRR